MRTRKLVGFTLFEHPGKGWQMSIKRKDEPGWSVNLIAPGQADALFSMLDVSEGPIRVADYGVGPAVRALPEQRQENSRLAVKVFETELAACEAAVRRLTAALNR